MPIDPPLLLLAPMLEGFPPPPDAGITPADLRAQTGTAMAAMPAELLPLVRSVEDRTLQGPGGPLGVRIYRPDAPGPTPTVVFFHGGGFVLCDLESHDSQVRDICRQSEAVVVSVDYRLAPEHPFPAAVEDAVHATRWAAENIAELGGDAHALAVAGDSAGGGLAAVVAQQLRSSNPALVAQLLIYPIVDMRSDFTERYPSATDHSDDGILLTEQLMRWFRGYYCTPEQAASDARCSPILSPDLAGLAPAVIVTAEYDPLRDAGEAYGAALAQAGVPVDVRRFDSLVHGFFPLGMLSPVAQAAVEETCELFRAALHDPARTAPHK